MLISGLIELRNNSLSYSTTGVWDISTENVNLDLYNKSRMMGDYPVRFCEKFGVKLPLLTRRRDVSGKLIKKKTNDILQNITSSQFWQENNTS